jgi:hypothetical protein
VGKRRQEVEGRGRREVRVKGNNHSKAVRLTGSSTEGLIFGDSEDLPLPTSNDSMQGENPVIIEGHNIVPSVIFYISLSVVTKFHFYTYVN